MRYPPFCIQQKGKTAVKIPESVKKMYEVLSCIPPDFEAAEKLFARYQPTEEEMMWLAVELTENAYEEAENRKFLYRVMDFLLEQGLDPNTRYAPDTTEEENVMSALKFVYGTDEGARTMRLLLEHGGDPNLEMDCWTPFEWIDTDLSIDPLSAEEKDLCENFVQCLLVMQAYGGHFKDGAVPFVMRDGYSSEIFKEFEKFDFRIGHDEEKPGCIHVFEKATGTVVADYI